MSEKTYICNSVTATGDVVAQGKAYKTIGFNISTTAGAGSATIRTGGVAGDIKGQARTNGGLSGSVMFSQPIMCEDGLHVSAISGTNATLEIYYRQVKGG